MAPIRVLQVMPAMDAGGMETFVMNVYRTIEKLMQAADSIINCGDAGQEGELIQRWGGASFPFFLLTSVTVKGLPAMVLNAFSPSSLLVNLPLVAVNWVSR